MSEQTIEATLEGRSVRLPAGALLDYLHGELGTEAIISHLVDNGVRYCTRHSSWGRPWTLQTEEWKVTREVVL